MGEGKRLRQKTARRRAHWALQRQGRLRSGRPQARVVAGSGLQGAEPRLHGDIQDTLCADPICSSHLPLKEPRELIPPPGAEERGILGNRALLRLVQRDRRHGHLVLLAVLRLGREGPELLPRENQRLGVLAGADELYKLLQRQLEDQRAVQAPEATGVLTAPLQRLAAVLRPQRHLHRFNRGVHRCIEKVLQPRFDAERQRQVLVAALEQKFRNRHIQEPLMPGPIRDTVVAQGMR
eukprot:scaffold859_cov306-Pinguiococcus_pyrenoidosus.AAC.16